MAEPSHRRAAGLLVGLSIGLSIAGCGLIGDRQGNPAEPVLVAGRVLDAEGRPVANAAIQLSVSDYSGVNEGDAVPTIFHRSFSTGPDGTFAIHLAPTPELLAFAAEEGGFVNFDVVALIGTTPALWGFPRELVGATWAGDPPLVELSPRGAVVPGQEPGVPAPEPAAT